MGDLIIGRGLLRIHPSDGEAVAALRGVDLTVGEGEIAAVVGPSGSGKSTLLRLIAGLDRPSAGSLVVGGLDIGSASEAELDAHRRDRIGVVEQHYRRALSPYLTAAAAIDLPLALRGVRAPERRARVDALLGAVGLGERGGAYRMQLSGGEQQRIAFAVALAHGPSLLLADEPTGELDGATASDVLAILRELVRTDGVTCLIVTHDEAVERIADRVVHLADGRAVAERIGPPGTPVARTTDTLGWLAPPLPERAAPVSAAERSGDAEPAVTLDAASRLYEVGAGRAMGLPPTTASFRRGGFHVVTGPSGSGKSTLLRLVTGLDRPTGGRVATLGQDLAALDRNGLALFRARHIGLVDQVRDLVPFLSALENVELGLAIRDQRGPEARDRARAALERFGLGAHAERSPDGLSAGERLRVALARAMASEPDLLVLDEPTAALDRHGAAGVAALLAGLDDGSVTVLATTHDPALIDAASDRLDLTSMRQPIPQR